MYLTHTRLKNIRCFKDSFIDLPIPDSDIPLSNMTLILGQNGSGKSSVLKAMALAVLTPIIEDSGFRSYHMIREGCDLARIDGTLLLDVVDGASAQNQISTSLGLRKRGDTETLEPRENLKQVKPVSEAQKTMEANFYADEHPSYFLVGYGATRRMEQQDFKPGDIKRRMMPRYHRVASLFDDSLALMPLNAWLPDLSGKRRKQAITLINQLLPEEGFELLDQPVKGEYFLRMQGLSVPFSALSDGYRAFLAWATDLVGQMCRCVPEAMALEDLSGLVLVDEIDLHLHPEWQIDVISRISQTFQRLQFVLTSHSPIVAGTLPAKQIFYTHSGEDGAVSLKQGEEEIQGRSSEQILLSPYFGLESTRAPGGIRQQLEALARRADEGDIEAAKAYLSLAGTGSA